MVRTCKWRIQFDIEVLAVVYDWTYLSMEICPHYRQMGIVQDVTYCF
jgi:hypothetical protein